ncbi:MAG: sulfotransferase domain-containing protein [Erysipelotrichaceae bacterium]
MGKINYIHVLGYGWTGSSAVIDLLKEYDNIFVPNLEFRLIKERYGLSELETMLTTQWDPIETDLAIKDFLWLAKKLDERISKFYYHFGHCYSSTIGPHFMRATIDYVHDLVDYQFRSSWHFFYWRLNVLQRALFWLRKRLHLSEYSEIMYFTKPITEEVFEDKTKKYVDDLFNPIIDNEKNYVVLDQGVPAHYPEYAFKYTNNARVIIIDRDPRDVYVDLVSCKELIGAELAKEDNADMFISWYKSLHFRKNEIVSKEEDVLFINFEDIILNYDQSVKRIEKYLGIESDNHNKQKTFFKPELSKKNIGIWKLYKNQEVMQKIKEVLREYCYE